MRQGRGGWHWHSAACRVSRPLVVSRMGSIRTRMGKHSAFRTFVSEAVELRITRARWLCYCLSFRISALSFCFLNRPRHAPLRKLLIRGTIVNGVPRDSYSEHCAHKARSSVTYYDGCRAARATAAVKRQTPNKCVLNAGAPPLHAARVQPCSRLGYAV